MPDKHEDNRKKIEEKQKAVDAAASVTRNNYLFFLGVLLYFLALAQSTTHEQLFKNSDIVLPGLNIGISLYNFYAFVPWLVMLLHLNVIFSHYILARKIFSLDQEIGLVSRNQWRRGLVSPFFLSDTMLAPDMSWLLRFLLGCFIFLR